jgi:Txe/YoeB family toxin of Txe-Axe toxin-antitoxin module
VRRRRASTACSMTFDEEHRLVYLAEGDDIVILQVRYHYG